MLAVSEVSDLSSQNWNMSVRIATATKKCVSGIWIIIGIKGRPYKSEISLSRIDC